MSEEIIIRERRARLEEAASAVIELMRTASQPEDVARGSIDRFARAAGCEWAAYWMPDLDLRRVRRAAIWSAPGVRLQRLGHGPQRPTVSLSESNAAHVWRTRTPLWAASLVLMTALAPREGQEGDLQSGVWFAVKTDTATYGVIELLGRAFSPRTAGHLAAIERIGARLGHALEERRSAPPPRLH